MLNLGGRGGGICGIFDFSDEFLVKPLTLGLIKKRNFALCYTLTLPTLVYLYVPFTHNVRDSRAYFQLRGFWKGALGGVLKLPKKILKSKGLEMLFSAFCIIYFFKKKSILIKCKMTAISSGFVNLIHISQLYVYPGLALNFLQKLDIYFKVET